MLLITGIAIHQDYGFSWDEFIHRHAGHKTFDYIFKGDPHIYSDQSLKQDTIMGPDIKYFGPAFELVLVVAEKIFQPHGDLLDIYLMRHLINFLIFFVSAFFFFLLVKYLFDDWLIGLLGSFFYVLSPRLFASAFYNGKDLIVMALFTICLFTMVRYLKEKNWQWAVAHGVVCALAIDVRIVAIVLPITTFLFLILDKVLDKQGKSIAHFIVFPLTLCGFTILCWPWLWTNPIGRFLEAFSYMSHVAVPQMTLFRGHYIPADAVPWDYTFVWMILSSPIVYSLGFLLGVLIIGSRLIKNPLEYYRNHKNWLLFLFLFLAPMLAIIFLKSVLYDEWRHTYFIYPLFLLIAIKGIIWLFEIIKTKIQPSLQKIVLWCVVCVIVLEMGFTLFVMIADHPYQNLYINFIARMNMQNVKKNYEMDYWGLTYRKALEYIASKDSDTVIPVFVNYTNAHDLDMLAPADRARFVYVGNPYQAKYLISDYRFHAYDYPFTKEFYSFKIAGVSVVSVFKMADLDVAQGVLAHLKLYNTENLHMLGAQEFQAQQYQNAYAYFQYLNSLYPNYRETNEYLKVLTQSDNRKN